MKHTMVKELMVPLSEYATVSENATLLEAIHALEDAQATFDQTRYPHRAILVYDKNDRIVGKLSQHDVISAMEPKYRKVSELKGMARFGISSKLLNPMFEQYKFWDTPLSVLCKSAAKLKVGDIMYTPSESEYIKENDSMDEAIHRLHIGQHQSLLVTRDRDIVGILRLTDVFATVCEAMMENSGG
jgi:CBS domain-containing protein